MLPAAIRRLAAESGPMPKILTRAGAAVRGESIELGLEVVDLLAELTVAAGKGAKRVPARGHGTVQTTGTEALAARDEGTGGETIEGLAKFRRSRDNPGPSSG